MQEPREERFYDEAHYIHNFTHHVANSKHRKCLRCVYMHTVCNRTVSTNLQRSSKLDRNTRKHFLYRNYHLRDGWEATKADID